MSWWEVLLLVLPGIGIWLFTLWMLLKDNHDYEGW